MKKKIINILLICIIGIALIPIIHKHFEYREARIIYKDMQNEKMKYDNWIEIEGTRINYPIAYGEGDDFYLFHTIDGQENASGSVFFSDNEKPYDGINSTISAHSMQDGSMFTDLHLFKDDGDLFRNSNVKITRDGEEVTYKPLGLYVTNHDWFYYNLDNYNIEDAVNEIQSKTKYTTNIKISEDSHIITLLTCEYSEEGNRLLLHYISE